MTLTVRTPRGHDLRAFPTGLIKPTWGLTVLGSRLVRSRSIPGDELFEIDPDGADTEGTRLRAFPTGPVNPTGDDRLGQPSVRSRQYRRRAI